MNRPTERYEAKYGVKPGEPPYLWDTHSNKVAGTFITFEGAAARGWILNQFSSGLNAELKLSRNDSTRTRRAKQISSNLKRERQFAGVAK